LLKAIEQEVIERTKEQCASLAEDLATALCGLGKDDMVAFGDDIAEND